MKLKKFTNYILVLLIVISSYIVYPSHAGKPISPEDAHKHIGEIQTVCGHVASTYYSVKSKGQPTFLNLNKPYPEHIFTIVIWGSDRHKFGDLPEIVYKNKDVCVAGEITTYKNKSQIVAKDSSQIKIK
jgi:hypothetical protein